MSRPTRSADGSMPPQVWQTFAGVSLVLVVAYVWLPSGNDVAYLALGVLATGAVVLGARVNQPRRPRAWQLMAAGLGSWVAGDAVYSLGATLPADLLYLAGYPLLAAGLFSLGRARTPTSDRGSVVDAWTVTAGIGVVAYSILARPLLTSLGLGTLDTVTNLGFIAGDLLLLGGLIRILSTPGAWGRPAWLLLGGLTAVLLADVGHLADRLLDTAVPSLGLDVLWLLGYAAWGAAALHPRMVLLSRRGTPRDQGLGHRRVILSGVAASIPVAVLGVEALLGREVDVALAVAGTVLMLLLVMTRMRIAFEQVGRANLQASELRDQLTFEATHDALTLLPNRGHGITLLTESLQRSRAAMSSTWCLFIDLDGFKQVNDTLGHAAGDQLLRRVAERLQSAVRGHDRAIRLGGDEFVVVLEDVADREAVVAIAERLLGSISRPVNLGRLGTAHVGASIGVARAANGQSEADALLNQADVAAYRAKALGRGRVEVFDQAMADDLSAAEQTGRDLRSAIEQDQLLLHYQPILDTVTGEIRGYESLVRWDRPGVGLLSPGDFLAVAEASDLIGELDGWVLREATRQMEAWSRRLRRRDLVVTVNIAPRHAADHRLVERVRSALRASGLPAGQLVLELHERVLDDTARTVRHLREVRELGAGISISDFGSSITALGRLADLPVDVVKIGGPVVDVGSAVDDKLLHLTIQAARAVGLTTVAENVERDDQLAVLRTLDCEMVQGYALGHPMSVEDVERHHQERVLDRFSGLGP